jgi:hypothetical protein
MLQKAPSTNHGKPTKMGSTELVSVSSEWTPNLVSTTISLFQPSRQETHDI